MKNNIFRSWGISIMGPGHIKKGLPNQDAFLIKRLDKHSIVCVVSDGLGSKRLSDKGSKEACKAVVKAVKAARSNKQMKTDDLLNLIHAYWLTGISPDLPIDCGATCLFVYINKEKVFAGQLGDGLIILKHKTEDKSTLLNDNLDNNFSNTTKALSGYHKASTWRCVQEDRRVLTNIMLCTDGISADLQENKELDFLNSLISSLGKSMVQNRLEAKKWLEQWPVKGHTDDKTIVYLELGHGE